MSPEGLRMADGLCLVGGGACLPIYSVPSLIFSSSAVHLPRADPALHEPFLSFYWYRCCKTAPPGDLSWVLYSVFVEACHNTPLALGNLCFYSACNAQRLSLRFGGTGFVSGWYCLHKPKSPTALLPMVVWELPPRSSCCGCATIDTAAWLCLLGLCHPPLPESTEEISIHSQRPWCPGAIVTPFEADLHAAALL